MLTNKRKSSQESSKEPELVYTPASYKYYVAINEELTLPRKKKPHNSNNRFLDYYITELKTVKSLKEADNSPAIIIKATKMFHDLDSHGKQIILRFYTDYVYGIAYTHNQPITITQIYE